MIELTPGAQSRLDDYLAEIRRVLAGSSNVNSGEVEQDIRDHIQSALSGQGGPIGESTLDAELRKLGPPGEWLPDGDVPWYLRSPAHWLRDFRESAVHVGHRLAGGPESYRMAYLSLAVLAIASVVGVVVGDEEGVLAAAIGAATAFVLSRAALSLLGDEQLAAAQKWLLYPALLLFYVPLLVAIVVVVPAIGGVALYENVVSYRSLRQMAFQKQVESQDAMIAIMESRGEAISPRIRQSRETALAEIEKLREPLAFLGRPMTPAAIFAANGVIVGVWIMFLAAGAMVFPSVVRGLFYPFGERFRPRWGLVPLLLGGCLLTIGAVALVA